MKLDNDTTMTETNINATDFNTLLRSADNEAASEHVVHQRFSDGPQEIYERKPIMHNIDSRNINFVRVEC